MKKSMVVAIMAIIVFAFFSTECFSQTILGCYHNKNGKLRVVSDFSQCKKTELPITFNTGEQGPPGPQGPQGPQGEQGPPGVVQGPIVLMETGGGVATQSTNLDGNPHVLWEYPCSANSPDYIHVSFSGSSRPGAAGGSAKIVIAYNDNDSTTYDDNAEGPALVSYHYNWRSPTAFEFDAAKRQLTDTTCAFWKIVTASNGEPHTVRYNYSVTYPQK